ncbi:MAG: hypothetical protein HUK22_01995, partial [Thermoguttaceae bacterium]|nr:hypothetical protein [Thermoguttaceae bacterium]
TLVGEIDGVGYYVDKTAGMWRQFKAEAESEKAFDSKAADFGLTGGTVATTAQNFDATGAPASRVGLDSQMKFDVGAYAIQVKELEGMTLDVAAPKVGDVVTATVVPEGAPCLYQWYRVDEEGSATAITGATSATYTVGLADGDYKLCVVAAGAGYYMGAVAAWTETIARPTVVVVEEATEAALVEAVDGVAEGGTILFADSLADSTITLSGTQIKINKSVTIDAGDLNITIDAAQKSRIFNIGGESEVALCGLTLTGGNSPLGNGGAIFNFADALTLTNMTFTGNYAEAGGAIFSGGPLVVKNSMFAKNSAEIGAAIENYRETCSVADSTFVENSASLRAGAIYNNQGSLTVANSTFASNVGELLGGAIMNASATCVVTDATFTGNASNAGGAILSAGAGACAITNAVFAENTAKQSGGAIYSAVELSLTNSSLVGNTSGNGGAIMNYASTTLTNSTLADNSADHGGAVYNTYDAALTLANTIATGNSGQNIYCTLGNVVNSYYSVIGDGSAPFAQNVDSQLNAAPQDVFQYDESGKIVLENGTPVISADGLAATTGTLVGESDGVWYYVDKAAGMWRQFAAEEASDMAFDAEAADFGLTGGKVSTTALNVDAIGEPVLRVFLAAASKFDVGAYAVPLFAPVEGVALSVSDPYAGDYIAAIVTPADATCAYQWYRVSAEGVETAIEGATGAAYVATAADADYYLKVVATGIGDYYRTASAQTASPVVVAPFEVVLSTTTPAYYDTITIKTSPALAKKGASFQWYYVNEDGSVTVIEGATNAYYKVKDDAVGKGLKVAVTGVGEYAGRASASTEVVANPEISRISLSRTAPAYADTVSAKISPTLARAAATYQWYRVAEDGAETAIEGATNRYYKILTSEDFGCKLKVVATAGGVFVGTAEATTPYAVTPAPLVSLELSTNEPTVGELVRFTKIPGAATCTYQWYRIDPATQEMTRIEGAIYSAYRATKADVGYQLKAYAW